MELEIETEKETQHPTNTVVIIQWEGVRMNSLRNDRRTVYARHVILDKEWGTNLNQVWLQIPPTDFTIEELRYIREGLYKYSLGSVLGELELLASTPYEQSLVSCVPLSNGEHRITVVYPPKKEPLLVLRTHTSTRVWILKYYLQSKEIVIYVDEGNYLKRVFTDAPGQISVLGLIARNVLYRYISLSLKIVRGLKIIHNLSLRKLRFSSWVLRPWELGDP